MRVLRGTLTFVLGMIIGIILFVIAIGGAVMIVGTSITVGELQGNFTDQEVVSPDSTLYGQTLWEAIQGVVNDVQNLDTLTMRTLYEHYGIELLNGISGIDFTTKDFYDTNVKTLMEDLSVVVNSFTLNDISSLVGVDFSEYGLPILNENVDSNLQTALDNIMGSLNGDLTIRSINDNFGIDIGAADNNLIATLQDISLSSFGAVVNAITLDKLLEVDVDAFVPKNTLLQTYVKVDEYVALSPAQLSEVTQGAETYIAGAVDLDGDGTTDTLQERELRYIAKAQEDGTTKYVVDNSCYQEGFNLKESQTTFYRHVIYKKADASVDFSSADLSTYYVETYQNRIATIDGTNFMLKSNGYASLADCNWDTTNDSANGKVRFENAKYALADGTLEDSAIFYMMDAGDAFTKDSRIRTLKDGETPIDADKAFLCVNKGTSATILQIVAPMSVSELSKADDLLNSLTINDVIDTEAEGTAKVIKALAGCKLTEIGTKISELEIADMIESDDDSAPIIKALKNHHCTLDNIGSEINKFAIGEVLDVKYDEFLLADATHTGDYVQELVQVPFNQYVHNESEAYYNGYGEKVVDIVKYRLYRDSDPTTAKRYYLNLKSESAIALQYMAKRGYTLTQIGSQINNMGFDELVRVEPSSSLIMKSLSAHGATLDNIGTQIDTFTLGEVIEINDESAMIMKSLKDKKISELGTVADELTLKEVTEITFDNFVENSSNGKYVKVDTATDSYFTLYNPAVHTGLQRYTRVEVAGSSSKVLQRLANCTIGNFSNAFDTLTLGDVLDIDIDVLSKDDIASSDKSYFYYDETNSMFMRQNDSTSVDDSYKNFYISNEGTSSSVLKRLAYVSINNLSSAMETVMKDMMLSELIDIHTQSAVSIRKDDNAITANDLFIVKPMGSDDGGEYVFVYDAAGKYIKRDKAYIKLTADELTALENGTVSYSYGQITTINEFTTEATTNQNVYYKSTKDGVVSYEYNLALCTYVASKNTNISSPIPTSKGVDYPLTTDKLYERVSGASTAPTYVNDGSLYVLLNGIYQPYDASNLVHANLDIYKLVSGDSNGYYVGITTPDDGTGSYKYQGTDESGASLDPSPLYAKRYCEDIYVQSTDTSKTLYVYMGGQYIAYSESMSASTSTTYEKVTGYLAVAAECYLSSDGGTTFIDSTKLNDDTVRVSAERQKSEKVLQTLADVTIGGINDKIKNAKVGDLMDVTPGSLFEEFKDSTLSDVGTGIQVALKNWTVADLAEKANITSLDPMVKSALEGVTLDNFFKSLEYNPTTGIVVNLEKAYGLA